MDKLTDQPLTTNYLKVGITLDGESLVGYEANDIEEYRIEIPVGAEAKILVSAPSYHDWEMMLRPKAAKFMEGPVELMPVDSTEKMNEL